MNAGGVLGDDPASRMTDVPGSVRFVHAADLHLDAVFAGVARDMPPVTARRLHQATFTALDNLFALCERARPDLLLLSGDMYNQEDWSLRAQLAVRDGCAHLGQLGTRVFIVHGNRDPLPSRLKTLSWPDCVTVFGGEVSAQVVRRGETPVAVIHGVSHAVSKESRNLAAGFARTPEDCLHIGLLHAALDASGGDRCARCSVEDLAASGLDYWALGHVHDHRVVCQKPLAQYPGSAQGLHVGEQGPHGCLLVTATPEDGGFVFDTSFQPLGPVEWHVLDVPAGEDATLDELENTARAALAEAVQSAVTARGRDVCLITPCTALIVRLRISGRTRLDAELRHTPTAADLLERLRSDNTGEPLVWIKDLEVDTRPLLDRAHMAAREDLLGEILRLADRYRNSPDLLAGLPETALGDLYGHLRARKVLSVPDEAELRALLHRAEALCLDMLENE